MADILKIKIYIVGGYVRDSYLKRERTDFDITVVGDAISFAKKIAIKFNSKAVVYGEFFTAMVPIEDFKIEFVGTRKEEYLPNSRKPKVIEGTLEDDLKRRDFTVNTLAASLNKENFGDVIDIFNGLNDIDRKYLRTPLEPDATFTDDPLRMMRAARFASQLGFTVDPESMASAIKLAERIKIISQERISEELLKILKSQKPSTGFNVLYNMGLLEHIFPELYNLTGVEIVLDNNMQYGHKDVFRHTLQVVDKISADTDNVWLRFAALVHDIAKPKTKQFKEKEGWTFHGHEELGARMMGKLFRKMRFPLDNLEYVEKLVRLHQRPMQLVDDGVTDSAVRRLAFHAGDALHDLFTLCKADITTKNPQLGIKYLNNYARVERKVFNVQEKDRLREFQSPVRGEEIMEECELKPCRAVGFIKESIEEAILDGLIPNEYEAAKAYFLENKNNWLKEAKKEGYVKDLED